MNINKAIKHLTRMVDYQTGRLERITTEGYNEATITGCAQDLAALNKAVEVLTAVRSAQ